MNLIEETRWSIERAKEAARTVFSIPEAEIISESLDRCLEAYRGKQREPEKPLTLEELRGMDEKEIEIRLIRKCHCNDKYMFTGYFEEYPYSDYGKTWLAYAHKPEGSEAP